MRNLYVEITFKGKQKGILYPGNFAQIAEINFRAYFLRRSYFHGRKSVEKAQKIELEIRLICRHFKTLGKPVFCKRHPGCPIVREGVPHFYRGNFKIRFIFNMDRLFKRGRFEGDLEDKSTGAKKKGTLQNSNQKKPILAPNRPRMPSANRKKYYNRSFQFSIVIILKKYHSSGNLKFDN